MLSNSEPRTKTQLATGFKPFLLSQFLGTLNDNSFKILVSLLIAEFALTNGEGISYLCMTQIFFALPYVIFASWAGTVADRYSKSETIKVFKLLEIVLMGLGAFCFVSGYYKILLLILFLMGLQSTLMSPCKYGILPELLKKQDLSRGNGQLEFFNFMAIIFGTALGSVLNATSDTRFLLPGFALVSFACLGFVASLKIPKQEVANAESIFEKLPWGDVFSVLKEVKENRYLWLVFIAIAFFWFIGSFIQLASFVYIGDFKELNFDIWSGAFLTSLAIGIGVGSISAGIVSRGKVELGLVPLGMVGMALASLVLGIFGGSIVFGVISAFFSGIAAGAFIVPLDAYLQEKSPLDRRGKYIAASNFVSLSSVIAGALLVWLLVDGFGFAGRGLFLLIGLIVPLFTVFAVKTMPEMFVRCLNWLVTNIFYKVNVKGLGNIPETGGALIVCNHVSYADASIILAATKRPVRFVIYKPIYEKPLVKLFAKAVQAIPVDSKGNPKETMAALKKARQIVESGELVCIFAEGGLTRVGNMLSFNKGLEKIVKGLDQPIIPACLDQLWGSVFSYSGGNVIRKWPRQVPYRLNLVFGEALPSTSKAWEVRQRVQELAADSAISRRKDLLHLQNRFLSVARKNIFSPCISDTTGKSLNYFTTLSSSLALASRLKREEGDMVGILLPTSVAGVISNLAALFAGKVPVNLNYTASSSALESAVQQCGIKTIISSGEFIEKIPGELPESSRGLVKEVSSLFEFSAVEKLKAALMALFLPSFLLKRLTGFRSSPEDSLATVIFSSGSTGEPKGVKLTHANIMSNIDSMFSVFQVGKKDSMIGVLPLFHAFGFTGTFWLPILSGVRSNYHPNPLEASVIGELVQKEQGTILMSTPTFLTGFLRRCKPEQLKTLRFVITGAEKLSERLAQSFQKKFGVLPMEGYGASELSPVAVMNVPDFKDSRVEQTGNKPGTVGHPLPGVAVRVVGIEDGKLLAPGEDGLMLVKGPNVMEGYLNNEKKTAEVLKDGWYQTGDVARLDEDGFITITDRLSRFSKIGGEMVPHLKIEESIYQVIGATKGENFACVVTAVPDEKKGEKLVVLSTVELDAGDLKQQLSEVGLPNLWIPKQGSYIEVEEIPMLGSGKTDLKAVKSIAAKAFA